MNDSEQTILVRDDHEAKAVRLIKEIFRAHGYPDVLPKPEAVELLADSLEDSYSRGIFDGEGISLG